jgi:hypothetical protein
MTMTACDPILLLEDDTRPTLAAWDSDWIAAVCRWQHVNYCYGFEHTGRPPGRGTVDDPYLCRAFGGNCTMTTRKAVDKVGYLDTRFRGYGWEHVEWTWRFQISYRLEWRFPADLLPCLDYGVASVWPPSFFDQDEMNANGATYAEIRRTINGPYRTGPWHDESERNALTTEVELALEFSRYA